ncbi:MAG TPA: ORF6N domain-containing protein [Hanamia sp.]|nr:ORF6N domain-containing protein [Hanamia sp.]
MQTQFIQQKIFEIRGQKVMLDFDLAELYKVETKVLNQTVKRNIERFPEDFMFRLRMEEWNSMRSQIVTTSAKEYENQDINRSQFVTGSQKHRSKSYLPFVFTEHGVTMLASVLRSDTAVKMNIAIVRAFIALRKFAIQYKDILEQLDVLKERISGHDVQLNQIYEALENMLDKKVEEENKAEAWKTRKRIGFKN